MKKIHNPDPESWFYSTGSSGPRNNEGIEVPTRPRGDMTRGRFYYVPRQVPNYAHLQTGQSFPNFTSGWEDVLHGCPQEV